MCHPECEDAVIAGYHRSVAGGSIAEGDRVESRKVCGLQPIAAIVLPAIARPLSHQSGQSPRNAES